MGPECVVINGREYRVLHETAPGSRAYGFVEGTEIHIKVPMDIDRNEGDRIFRLLLEKARKRIEKGPGVRRRRSAYESISLRIENNSDLEIMGHRLRIEIRENYSGSHVHVRLMGNVIAIDVPEGISREHREHGIKEVAVWAISRYFVPVVRKKLDELNALHFNESFNNISIRPKLSNWGSCSGSKRNININFRLLLAPNDVIDYVLLHELAHLREPNHSVRFWGLVEKEMPGYKAQVRWLRENGHTLGYGNSMCDADEGIGQQSPVQDM